MKKSQRRYRITLILTLLIVIASVAIVWAGIRFLPSDVSLVVAVVSFLFGPPTICGFIAREKGVRGRRLIAPLFIGFVLSLFAIAVFLWLPYTPARKAELDEGLKEPDDSQIGRFRRVRYYIGGSAAYTGDLFVTHEVVYYVPLVDILESRIKAVNVASSIIIQSLGKSAGRLGAEVAKPFAPLPQFTSVDYGRRPKVQADTVEACVENLKLQQPLFLPAPIRVTADEIQNISFSGGRTLGFDVANERHEFKVRLRDERRLREALMGGDYLKQREPAN